MNPLKSSDPRTLYYLSEAILVFNVLVGEFLSEVFSRRVMFFWCARPSGSNMKAVEKRVAVLHSFHTSRHKYWEWCKLRIHSNLLSSSFVISSIHVHWTCRVFWPHLCVILDHKWGQNITHKCEIIFSGNPCAEEDDSSIVPSIALSSTWVSCALTLPSFEHCRFYLIRSLTILN